MTRSHKILPLLVVLAATPGTALAATAEVREGTNRMEAVYTAAPGERNDVLVSHVDDYTLRIADPGAVIAPGAGCRAVDQHTVECANPDGSSRFSYLYAARVLAGDGDDVVRSSKDVVPGIAGPTALRGPQIIADGGSGSDRLEGGASGDELNGGGGGHDVLNGGGNNDELTDGDTTGAADSDEIDGGEERDTISYEARTARVVVDLDNDSGEGEAGEGDVVRDVENVTGGSAADTIGGDSGDNWLTGGSGDDRIVAGAGDDQLEGEGGRDRLYGQQGNDGVSGGSSGDALYGGSGRDGLQGGSSRDLLLCGPSSDVGIDTTGDSLTPDCEDVSLNYGYRGGTVLSARAHPVAARHGSLTFLIGCPLPEELDGGCDVAYGKVRITDSRGKLMGTGTLTKAAGTRSARNEKPARVTVKLNGHGRYRLGRRFGSEAVVSLRGHALPTANWAISLPRVR